MRRALSLGAISGSNIIIAFLYQWYILTTIGPGIKTDALFAGMTMPQLVLAVISGSLMHVLVPLLAGEEKEKFRRDAWGFFLLIGSVFTILAVILYISAPIWVPLFFPGFSEAGKSLVIILTRIQLFSMVFTALYGVLSATYHARRRFVYAEMTPLIANIISIGLLILLLPSYGIESAAWIGLIRAFLQMIFLLPGLGKFCKPYWYSGILQEAWRRISPLLLGAAYYKTDIVVDRFLTSMGPPGGLTLFYLGQQLFGAATQVINSAIATPMVPLLAGYAKNGNYDAFRSVYRKRLLWMISLTGIGYILFILIGKKVLKLLIGHGGVTEQNLLQLWLIMLFMGGVFIGGALGQITSTTYYSKGDTNTPTRFGIITYTVFVPIKFVAFYFWGLIGLAASTSFFLITNFILQFYFLEKGYKNEDK